MKAEATGYDKIYCYKNSNVLKNKLDIRSQELLQKQERMLTFGRILELYETPIKGGLDFDHLKAIHKYIFSDIYDWAGKDRNVDIAKSNLFCRAMFIRDLSNDIFTSLRQENFLISCPAEKVAERLAYYYGEINALHPFREGNGRTQREFIRCNAAVAGYELNFASMNEDALLQASIESMDREYDHLTDIFKQNMSPLRYQDQFKAMKQIANGRSALGAACDKYYRQINRISRELKELGYKPMVGVIREIEKLERMVGHVVNVKELNHLSSEGEIGSGVTRIKSLLSPLPDAESLKLDIDLIEGK